jgi:hypothetical protein
MRTSDVRSSIRKIGGFPAERGEKDSMKQHGLMITGLAQKVEILVAMIKYYLPLPKDGFWQIVKQR